MKRKSIVSLLLAVMMTVSVLCGCAQTKEETETPALAESNAENKTETRTETEVVAEDVKEEPTVITVGSSEVWQSDPIPWYETDVWKAIQEEANVKIEFIQYDEEQFNLMLASGDTPDIVASNVFNKIDDVVKSGIALDMDPYIAEYAPNMANEIYAQSFDLIRTMKGGENNALYFLPGHIGVENVKGGIAPVWGYVVRWDWYKEIGAPEINSDDEYIDVLEQMVALHPTNENGDKVYGMGVYDFFLWWYFRGAFVEPTLLNPWTFSLSQFMSSLETGELVNGYTNVEKSAYWTDMVFFNKLYNRGLLDPDSFSQTSDEYVTKSKAGRYAAVAPWKDDNLYSHMKDKDPNTNIGHVCVPSDNYLFFANKNALTGNFPSWYTFISSKSENVEACMRFFNVLHDLDTVRMIYSGFEGVHWNYVDGVPTFTDEVLDMIKSGSEELKKIGIRIGVQQLETVFGSFNHEDGYPVDLTESDEIRAKVLNSIERDVADYYGVSYPSQAFKKYVDEGKTIDFSKNHAQMISTMMPAATTDVSRMIEKLNDICYRAISKLVMAKDQAEFEAVQAQVLKDLENAGVEECYEWVKTHYDAADAVARPIYEAVK